MIGVFVGEVSVKDIVALKEEEISNSLKVNILIDLRCTGTS